MTIKIITLKNWQFKNHQDSEWVYTKDTDKTTTEIFTDLIDHGIIPDPFIDQNEKKVQWVGEQDWDYKSVFDAEAVLTEEREPATVFLLKLNGLDTFANVYLNGELILESENMFVVHELQINKTLLKPKSNELEIHFKSALLQARSISKEQYGGYVPKGFNGEGNRNYIRKAQYHYGWDWGPILMSCGPYKPIELIMVELSLFINDVYIYPTFHNQDDLTKDVELNLELEYVYNLSSAGSIDIEIISPDGSKVAKGELLIDHESSNRNVSIKLQDVLLWYPNGYGDQPLYTAKFYHSETLIKSQNFGIRKLELVQEKLYPETKKIDSSFQFQINDIPIYCSGVNWIPAHSFPTAITDTDYNSWLSLVHDAKFNMVRIWGGGYYEPDFFYQECDRLGLLVWHDFMFACGQYPGDEKFVNNVKQEVSCQLKRLRSFCSIALWCGNNEDYAVAEQNNLNQDDPTTTLTATSFPAKHLYEHVLPNLVSKWSPLIPYHPGSPWSQPPATDSNDLTVGDVHQWNVWHGTQEPYQNWGQLQGRFVSEFGMLAFANYEHTLRKVITDTDELYPQSETVCFHNKASGSEIRVAKYLSENFKIKDTSLAGWCYLTQLMQSDCLVQAVRIWKSHWSPPVPGPGPDPDLRLQSGYIVWQINDCWPVNSWSIVDFNKIPKMAYYALKRENSLVSIGCERLKYNLEGTEPWKENSNDSDHQYDDYSYKLRLWICNLTLHSQEQRKAIKVLIKLIDVFTGELLQTYTIPVSSSLWHQNRSFDIPNDINFHEKKALLHCSLLTKDDELLYRCIDWPQPIKFLKFASEAAAGLELDIDHTKQTISLSAKRPLKGVWLYCDTNPDIRFSDNAIDLIPNEIVTINLENFNRDKIKYRYYDM